ncbi:MAG: NAD(P)/FAD-dependent oxidoreductase [Candidatus Chaera renei]|uniref:NAD(P)/FAD-dependent oxidoreductase n=1 Tax=Candidatus Chaera renei TaxID=2506947 RepID=A0A4Q0AJ95_9BACT|nr:MAG: NAD(P)/FAD-dependent oxidoreductase [Candidatus Chaera renei]
MAKQKYDYDLVVLGSGGGGSVAAHLAAKAGKRVAIVEAGSLGGECPNFGCVPTKALLQAAWLYDAAKHGQPFGIRSAAVGYNYPSIKAWKDTAVKNTGVADSRSYHESAGVRVLGGAAHFIGPHQVSVERRHVSAANFLVATGSYWHIPDIQGLDKAGFLTPREAINLLRPPKSLFIVGSGASGCEFAELFSAFGSKIYLADVAPRVLPREDQEVSRTVEEIFSRQRGMTILGSSKVLKVSREGALKKVVFQRGGHEQAVKVEEILIAAGRLPNTDIGLENAGVDYSPAGINVNQYLQTSARHIYAAGDVIGGYMLTHVATYESRVAAHNLIHREKRSPDYRAVPRVTFLNPEVASVGASEEDCLRRDMAVRTALAPVSIIGRSNTSNFREGFVKVIADKSGRLIGASVVCPRAGEIIHELTLAIQYDLLASEVASTLHAFPTWSEAVRIACSKI